MSSPDSAPDKTDAIAFNWKTIKVVYELSVHEDADAEQVAQDTFERLCDLYDAPYYACDGWEMLDTELRGAEGT